MKQYDLFNIKLNHISIFVTAAELGNFSTAAKYLHVTQPMVTKSIQALEKELGVILFLRWGGKLRLTPAGKELYSSWKGLLSGFEQSIEEAHSIQEGYRQTLHLGVGCMVLDDIIVELTDECFGPESGIAVRYETTNMADLWEQLNRDELDCIIVSGHTLPDSPPSDLRWKIIRRSCLAVYVSKKNPLALKGQLSISDLRSQQFISISPEVDKRMDDLLKRTCAIENFVPRIHSYIADEASFKINLLLNNGVVLADSATALKSKYVEQFLFPEFPNNILLVWKATNNNASIMESIAEK